MFGAEFLAMNNGVETVRWLCYRLIMMDVLIYDSSYNYGDNMLVLYNTQIPESTLNNNGNFICYQVVRESVAKGCSLAAHVVSRYNVA